MGEERGGTGAGEGPTAAGAADFKAGAAGDAREEVGYIA